MAFKFWLLIGNKDLYINVQLKISILCYLLILPFSILAVNNAENSKLTFIIFFFLGHGKSREIVKSGNDGNAKKSKKKSQK